MERNEYRRGKKIASNQELIVYLRCDGGQVSKDSMRARIIRKSTLGCAGGW